MSQADGLRPVLKMEIVKEEPLTSPDESLGLKHNNNGLRHGQPLAQLKIPPIINTTLGRSHRLLPAGPRS